MLGQSLAALTDSVRQWPILTNWAWRAHQPINRAMWASIGQQIGTAVLAGFVASLLVRWALRRWRARETELPLVASKKRRIKASLAYLAVDLLALLTFLGVTYFVLDYIGVTFLAQRVAGELLMAIACVRGATALSKAYLAPENSRRRLVHMDDFAAVEASAGWRCCSGWASTAISGSRRRGGSGCPGPSTAFSTTCCSWSSPA